MSNHIESLELIFYRNGTVKLISIDGDFYEVSDPTENDSSVYNVKIGKTYGKKVSIKVYSNDQNITEVFSIEAELSDKVATEDFTAKFVLD